MKPLEMPDNGWSDEGKAIVCRTLWGEPMQVHGYEHVASAPRVRPCRNYRDEIGGEDE